MRILSLERIWGFPEFRQLVPLGKGAAGGQVRGGPRRDAPSTFCLQAAPRATGSLKERGRAFSAQVILPPRGQKLVLGKRQKPYSPDKAHMYT